MIAGVCGGLGEYTDTDPFWYRILFIFGGLLGWVLKLLSYVVKFLWEGLTNIFSCLFWCIVIIIIIFCLL